MIPVYIDTSAVSEAFPMFENDVRDMMDYVIKEVTAGFAQQWQEEALRTLESSKFDYAKNIIVVDEGFAKGAVVLVGWLPNAIESGIGPFDMKPGLLGGPNAKTGKDGKMYNTVPYRLANPEALGESAVFSSVLPQEVYDVIQEKPQNIPTSNRGVKTEGLKVDEIPQQFREPEVRAVPQQLKSSFQDYQRKFSVYAGVSKVKDTVTGQNRYMSFRRISENSDPNSWLHKGIEAHNLAEKAIGNMRVDHIVGQGRQTTF